MSGKILIVDREPQTVRRVQAASKRVGMAAVVASTTAFALQLLVTERPDAVMFDVTARDGSWVSLIKSLRELDSEIAVIATGSNLSMHQVMEAMRHRVTDVLEKPLDEDLVAEALLRVRHLSGAVAPSAPIDIVFVDDDPMTLSFASKQLSARGVSARTVASLRAARQEIADRRPEAVVVDVVLQGENGLELIPELAHATPPIPAILITASADPRVAIAGLRAGAFSAFPKPLEWDAIYKSIVAARRWSAHRAAPPAAPEPAVVDRPPPPVPVELPPRPAPPIFTPQYHVLSLATPPAPRIFEPRFHVTTLDLPPPPAPEPPPPTPVVEPAPVFTPLFHVNTLESPPLPPEPPPAPVFEPQYHLDLLVGVPEPEPPPAPEPVPEPEPAPEREAAPIFEPQYHLEHMVGLPEAVADGAPAEPAWSPQLPPLETLPSLDATDLASQALARAALALASLPSGILILDARPAVVELNPAAEELLSLPRDRAVDGGVEELPHLSAFFETAKAVLEDGKGLFNQEAMITLPRGVRAMGFGAVPLQKNQKEGVLIYFQDITRRRGAAGQQRKIDRLASLGMIAAGLTAELADPVSMAATYADLIQKETSSIERCHHHAGRLRTALTRTTQLAAYVSTLLHRPPAEPGPVDLHEVIQGVLTSLQRRMLLGSREADQFLAATAPLCMGEAIDFEHLMLTVLMSCHHAVPRGGSLRVTSHNHTGIFELIAEARDAGIEVSDPGARPAADPPDYKAPLEICKNLLRRYGGAIRVDSEPGIPRRYTVRLFPARPEQCAGWAVQGVTAPPIQTNAEKGDSPVTLLISDEITRGLCISWLEEAGVFVLPAQDTDEALEAVHKLQPKVMIVQGNLQEQRFLTFLRRAADTHTTAIVNLLDQTVTPRLQADLDELPGHVSVRWPVDRLGLVQALALAELEAMELQTLRQSGSYQRPRQERTSEA